MGGPQYHGERKAIKLINSGYKEKEQWLISPHENALRAIL